MTLRHHLSDRGARLVSTPPFAEYVREGMLRVSRTWDPDANPDGYLALATAENDLMAAEMIAAMNRIEVPPAVLGYDAMVGSLRFRERLTGFMERSFLGRRFLPEQVAVLAGAGGVLEALFYAIADPGDGVLVPTPGYAGFWADLETRDGLHVVPVHRSPDDGYALTPERLDAAVDDAGRPVKALLLTSPDNPLGSVLGRDEILRLASWAQGHGIHVVFDEIYALSVFGSTPFVSVATVLPDLGDLVHVVWAFSKDFGASGLRCGVLVSENPGVLAAIDGQAYWSAVSADTQYRLGSLIADTTWVDGYIAENRRRLRVAYGAVTAALSEHGIPFVPAEAGIFLLVDLRPFLPDATPEAAHALWRRILDETNVNLTPGAACRIPEPGWMRLCYAKVTTEAALEGIRKVASVLVG